MDPRHLDMEIEIDGEHREWVQHPPNAGDNFRSTFRGPVTVWVVQRDPQGRPTRVPFMTPASVTVPIPRQVYRRRRIPQPSTSSSSGNVARSADPRTPTVDIPECRPDLPAYIPLARQSVPPRGPWITPQVDPTDANGAGGEANGEDEKEESNPSEEEPISSGLPSNATDFSNWRP